MTKARNYPNIKYIKNSSITEFDYLYHKAMQLPNALFFITIFIVFLLINLAFASAYLLSHGLVNSINPASTIKIKDALFFSMTFPIVGYGGLIPMGLGKILACLHVFCGLVYLSTLTGIIFARFSNAKSPLLWSSPIAICQKENQTYLKLRVTNVMGNDVINVIPSIFLQKNEYSKTGEVIRRLIPLKLETECIPLMAFSWIISHKVDKNSPLKNWVSNKTVNDERLVGFIHGLDSTIGANVYSYAKWTQADLVKGNFANIISKYSEDKNLQVHVEIDLSKIDSVV